MPEKFVGHLAHALDALAFFLVGVAISIWRTMESGAVAPRGVVFGRALSNGGLAMSAGAVLVWVPDLPWIGQFGVAAFLATLGTAGIERVVVKMLKRRAP